MKPRKIGMVERAVIAHKWRLGTVTANIHAMIGDDSDKMVNEAGRVLYVILGAAMAQKLSADTPEIRIIRGAVGALYDQVGLNAIPANRRASIVCGLEVASDLIKLLPGKALTDSACDLEIKLRGDHVMMSDFEEMVT